ncbi:MAG: peptidylprolyl isomerase [Dongiaceae bacterium]
MNSIKKIPANAGACLIKALLLAVLALPPAALASPMITGAFEIAAVVNDEVISKYDVFSRLQLILASTGLPDTPENRQRLLGQILRSLIDERLELQEAKARGIGVTDAEITEALNRLAAQNNMSPEGFRQMMAEKEIRPASLTDQIRSTLAWTKLVRLRFSTATIVTEEEIDETLAEARTQLSQPQYQVAEIFLSVDDSSREEPVLQLANNIVQQIIDGTPFAPLAQQFSQSTSAPQGGDLGWIRPVQLDDALEIQLKLMQPNQVSRPIKTLDGYTILFLRDIRYPAEGEAAVPSREDISGALRQQKYERFAKRLLRDLRRSASIDIRA